MIEWQSIETYPHLNDERGPVVLVYFWGPGYPNGLMQGFVTTAVRSREPVKGIGFVWHTSPSGQSIPDPIYWSPINRPNEAMTRDALAAMKGKP